MMAERHRKPVVKGNYAVYFGEAKEFPHSMTLIPHNIYEIGIYPTGSGYPFYQVRVKGVSTDIYLPYPDVDSIWMDWMPYGGKPIEKE